jgi:holliday junction DNA helicase RuvA
VFSYFSGQFIHALKGTNNRVLIVVEVNGIGYDLQITSRHHMQMPAYGDRVQIFTHLVSREDGMTLFGFASIAERDLFRQLISVSGIGPQMGMALLDTLSLQELVQAIVSGNTRLLSRTPGVGGKTAERIALELKSKLSEWRETAGLSNQPGSGPVASVREDVEMTLLALGYTDTEINKALSVVGKESTLAKAGDAESWIRAAIAFLSA